MNQTEISYPKSGIISSKVTSSPNEIWEYMNSSEFSKIAYYNPINKNSL